MSPMAAAHPNRGRWAGLGLCLWLTACGIAPTTRVEAPTAAGRVTWTPPRPLPSADQHRVMAGETLYAIAFRQGGDYRELARINGIAAPYTIYPGQLIQLREVAKAPAATSPSPTSSAPTPAPLQTPGQVVSPAVETLVLAPTSATIPATAGATAQAVADNTTALSSEPLTATAAPTLATGGKLAAIIDTTAATLTRDGVVWRWPTAGKIIGRFVLGDPVQQGIDLAGVVGQPVLAAADGEVVYSGDGLLGYGELVIVKHSPDYLSAYGHNQRRLAAEGDQVKAGQVIAELGQRGSLSLLHFEIRKQGKPVDPLLYLPPR